MSQLKDFCLSPFRVLPFFLAFLFTMWVDNVVNAEDSPAMTGNDYYLSPNGNDSATGSAEAPFATLDRALDQIRSDKEGGRVGTWTVHIAPGEYPLTEPFTLTPVDSGSKGNPVCYRGELGENGERPVFTGGVELTGWRVEGDVWVADLPEKDGVPLYFEQLFVNGRRATRARWPNEGFLVPEKSWEDNPVDKEKKIYPKTTLQYLMAKPGELDFLKSVPAEELRFAQLVVHHKWDTSRRILLGFDPESGTITLKGTPQTSYKLWDENSLYYIENVRSAFDKPGEWFYDGGKRKVFYYPLDGEKIESTRVIVPRSGLTQLMRVMGEDRKGKEGEQPPKGIAVKDIVFENLAFSYSDSPRNPHLMESAELDESVTGPLSLPGPSQFDPAQAASFAPTVIEATFAKRVVWRDCEVSHIGGYAFSLTNCQECRVERSELFDLGAGGIRLSGTAANEPTDWSEDDNQIGRYAQYNVIDNNSIRHGGRFHAAAVGIWLGNRTLDNEVTHNDIYDLYYTGVSAGWTWGYSGGMAFRNRIEFNKIHKIGQGALSDMGGVYTLGTSHGTRVCNNVIFDVKSHSYGGWGLYTDEGSEGITMENNLVYETTDGSFHQHYGRGNLIRNNILVNSEPVQVAISRVEPHRTVIFEKNLIVWADGDAIGKSFDRANAVIRNNLWFCSTGPATFRGESLEEWLNSSNVDRSNIVADPLFVDPEHFDFRLKPDSPALSLGFVPFDYSRAGLYGDPEWVAKGDK